MKVILARSTAVGCWVRFDTLPICGASDFGTWGVFTTKQVKLHSFLKKCLQLQIPSACLL